MFFRSQFFATYMEENEMSNSENNLYIETQIDNKSMYEFMLNHTYKSLMGFVGVFFSLLAVFALVVYWNDYDITRKLIFVFIALLFTVINPVALYFKSKKQVKMNDSFHHPLCYVFSTKGVDVKQGEQSLHINWEDIIKIVSTKNLIVIYLSPINAFIFPKKQIGDKFDDFKKIIVDNIKCRKVSIK